MSKNAALMYSITIYAKIFAALNGCKNMLFVDGKDFGTLKNDANQCVGAW